MYWEADSRDSLGIQDLLTRWMVVRLKLMAFPSKHLILYRNISSQYIMIHVEFNKMVHRVHLNSLLFSSPNRFCLPNLE